MRPRTLLVLAIVVAGLAAFIFFYERELPTGDELRERRDLMLDIEADEVSGLLIEMQEGETVELRRGSSDGEPPADQIDKESASEQAQASPTDLASESWRLVRPFELRAADSDVDGLVSALASLRHERVLDTFDADELGLTRPRARVSLSRGDETVTLLVGDAIPAYSSMAVQVEGQPDAQVVGDAVWAQLAKEPGEWRSREIVPAARNEIRRIAWRLDGIGFALGRRESELRIVVPYEDHADEELVDALLTALTSLRVERFLDSDEDPATTETPEQILRLQIEDQPQPQELALAQTGEEGELRVRYEGQAAVAHSELLVRLAGPAEAWRSRVWSTFDLWQVEQATLRDANGPVVLARTDDGWARDGADIPFNVASDLLDAVLETQADTVRRRTETWQPPGGPELAIELEAEDDTTETLALYADGVATVSGRRVLLDLPPDTAARLHQHLTDLRAAEPIESKQPTESAENATDR
ncbi:MAG: DUF4340 domain-containing protein [Thermoanaerobaculia bacterium]